jgi:hypothetical protein
MDDTDITLNGRQTWMKLEEILESFLEMMDQGKVVAVDGSYDGKQEHFDGWIMPSYTEQDLEDSLDALSALITAIETRLPSPPPIADFDTGHIDTTVPETSPRSRPRRLPDAFSSGREGRASRTLLPDFKSHACNPSPPSP